MELGEHLFRLESGRMVAALTRIFGVHNLALAEDVVQDSFCRALEVWRFRGIPQNPSAWLMRTAKNRALDVLRKERTARKFAPEFARLLESEWTLATVVRQRFEPDEISDDQLRMMFSCCPPNLSEVAHVALILNILCGFGVGEIAAAFVKSHAAIDKQIQRAKKALAASPSLFDTASPAEFAARLPSVHRALYLLFNEGYHGASPDSVVRTELCAEAMRLTKLLLRHPLGSTPATHALAALMCFNRARLPARVDADGNLRTLFEQDRSTWDRRLIAEGLDLLDRSATGPQISEYHLEAAIASVHATADESNNTNWDEIVRLYDRLLAIRPSPIVALSRAIALAQRDGPVQGLEAIDAISGRERLAYYPFYPAAIATLELRAGRPSEASAHFRAALALARNASERRFLAQRIEECLGQTAASGPTAFPLEIPRSLRPRAAMKRNGKTRGLRREGR